MDLSDRAALEGAARLLAAVQRALPGRPVLVVGAAARDWLLTFGHGIGGARRTYDVDLALQVLNWTEFMDARTGLMAQEGFAEVPGILHQLSHAAHGKLDLIPFGAIEDAHGMIQWPPPSESRMNMLGFTQAEKTAVRVRLPGQVEARVAALPIQAVLKVLAWEDRRLTRPATDAIDLIHILGNYHHAVPEDRLFAEHQELLLDPQFDLDRYSAWIAGQDARSLLEQGNTRDGRVRDLVIAILHRETRAKGPLRLVADARGTFTEVRILKLLGNFAHGLGGHSSLISSPSP